jgi:hypothetical protein
MVTNPTENSRKYLGIIVDRDDPNGLGGHKVFVPQLHGHNVDVEHLPWVRYTVPPGSGGASTNYGALDNGQLVSFEKDVGEGGTGFGTIAGLYQTKQKADPNMPGNVSLVKAFKQVADALEKESNIRVRPNIEEVFEGGAKKRKVVEKGVKHKHSLLKEMVSHAATFPLNGTILPQISNLSTGVEASQNILTADIQSLLPGVSLNLNSILSLIPPDLLEEVTSAIPADALVALQNTTALMGSVTTLPSGGATAGRRVDPVSFIASAVELLKGVSSPADLTNLFTELSTNTSIGSLPTELLNIPLETPFGPILQTVDPLTGAISAVVPDSIQQALASYGSLVSSLPGANGSNLFGDGSEAINAMTSRLNPELVGKIKDKLEKNVSTSLGTDMRKKVNQAAASFLG